MLFRIMIVLLLLTVTAKAETPKTWDQWIQEQEASIGLKRKGVDDLTALKHRVFAPSTPEVETAACYTLINGVIGRRNEEGNYLADMVKRAKGTDRDRLQIPVMIKTVNEMNDETDLLVGRIPKVCPQQSASSQR